MKLCFIVEKKVYISKGRCLVLQEETSVIVVDCAIDVLVRLSAMPLGLLDVPNSVDPTYLIPTSVDNDGIICE